MAEQTFQAPPPPPPAAVPEFAQVTPVTAGAIEKPSDGPMRSLYQDNYAVDLNLPVKFLKTKWLMTFLGMSLVIGMVCGATMFGGGQQIVQGLGGINANPDVSPNTPRCGMIAAGQECVLYIMNSSRQDRLAETFFDDAVRLTEVAKYSISMANPQYAKRLIKPGYIAQIKIPNVR